ncbi:MAG: SurA N-terminal domain-containing protein [Bacillaceae bacterium]|nr:SurA N-terminal domain-containing protein [Bacillaceae bacterium]
MGTKKKIAAIVNNEEIDMEEFEVRLNNTKLMYEQQGIAIANQGKEFEEFLAEQVLNSIIEETLLLQASEDIVVSEEKIDEKVQQVSEGYETEEEFQETLNANNLTEVELRELIKKQLKVEMYFEQNLPEVTVTDQEIEEIFAEYTALMEEDVDLEEVRPLLQDYIIRQKQKEQQDALVDELKANAEIEILM